MIALLAALEEEASNLRRRMALAPAGIAGLDGAAYTGLYRGRPVLLAWMGMGRQRAEEGAQAVLSRYPVVAVISIGFSGALEERLRVGDLILASDLIGVTDLDGSKIEPTVHRTDPELLCAARAALGVTPLRVAQGPTVSAPDVIDTPARKRDLGRRTGAVAVDMESYWVARLASDRGLPFLALRAISDAQQEHWPPPDQPLDENGAPRARPLTVRLLREPSSLITSARIARDTHRARRALTTAVTCVAVAL